MIKVGDIVRCSPGTEELFWYTEGVGLVFKVIVSTWNPWETETGSDIVKVMWTNGVESTISTKWLEVISG